MNTGVQSMGLGFGEEQNLAKEVGGDRGGQELGEQKCEALETQRDGR